MVMVMAMVTSYYDYRNYNHLLFTIIMLKAAVVTDGC